LGACDDLVRCAREICDALAIRQKYMRLAGQAFPVVVDRFLESAMNNQKLPKMPSQSSAPRRTILGEDTKKQKPFFFTIQTDIQGLI
jgi:hypothetical protein